jgi:hypothetical protein
MNALSQLLTVRRTLSILPAGLAVILCGVTPARAQEYSGDPVETATARELKGIAISLDLYGLRRLDDARSMWGGGKDRSARGLEVGYDLWRMGEGTRLALAIGWLVEKQTPTYGSSTPSSPRGGRIPQWSNSLESNSLHASATLRWRCDRAFQPYLGVAGGGTRSKLTLDGGAWPNGINSTSNGLLGRATAGLRFQPSFLTVKRVGVPLLAFALAAEVGALVGTPLEFSSRPPDPPTAEQQPIPVQPVALGDLGQTGGYGRLSVVVAF